MPAVAIGIGIILIILGLAGYFGTGMVSVTALIPAGFGLLLAILGAVGMKGGSARKHSMHVAAMVGLIGFIGGLRGVMQLPALFSETGEDAPAATAVWMQVAMCVLCLIFVALCVKSFINARRKQAAAS